MRPSALFGLLLVALSQISPVAAQHTSGQQGERRQKVAANEDVERFIENYKGLGAVGDPDSKPLSPRDALAAFRVSDDLQIELIAHEPDVRQPVSISFDERGRMWVVQYLQYPFPAGLQVVQYDKYLRAVFDKVPPPPPKHDRGADKITIHEDADGDGHYETVKTFVEGLNIATSCVQGRGGVWVLNPPYLLFYPDADRDDIPDSDPQVRLSGFGLEDTHAVANSLHWGPDGWLYGAQGSTCWATVSSAVTRDVHFKGQAIWRYHPETEVFEVFAEGGGNTFSLEFDAHGRCFSGTNNADTRGNHYVQGGGYRKIWGKHGPLMNPYAFGFLLPMAHHDSDRFSQAMIVYEGGALPSRFDGRIVAPNGLQHYVLLTDRRHQGSTFATNDLEKLVTTHDRWFRPVEVEVGPDGAIYLADWYDTRLTHTDPRDNWDKSNGRIYRLKSRGAAPLRPPDLSKHSTSALIALLSHKNRWFRETALRLIGDRKDRSAIPQLEKLLAESAGEPALEALWALHLCGGLDEKTARQTLAHANPYVRLWTVRLLGDAGSGSSELLQVLAKMCLTEPHPEVRSQLASTARRLSGDGTLPIVWNLLRRDEDADDPHIPLLLWWALESKAGSQREVILADLEDDSLWHLPIFRKEIASRLARRYTAQRDDVGLLACARLLALAPDRESVDLVLAGMDDGLAGDPVESIPDAMSDAFSRLWSERRPSLTLVRVGTRLRQPDATASAMQLVTNDLTPAAQRLPLLALFAEYRQPSLVPVLLHLLESSSSEPVRRQALDTLRRYADPQIADALLRVFTRFSVSMQETAQSILVSRRDWAVKLLQSVDRGDFSPSRITVSSLLNIQKFGDVEAEAIILKHWGRLRASPAEKTQQMAEIRRVLGEGKGDSTQGKKLFAGTCAKCHRLHNEGGQVGPSLDGYERDNTDFWLQAIVDPSLALREEYTSYTIATVDGQVLSGLIAEDTPLAITLVNVEGARVVVPREDIDELAASPISLMPDRLLDRMSSQEIRNLFAFLRSPAPARATEPDASQ